MTAGYMEFKLVVRTDTKSQNRYLCDENFVFSAKSITVRRLYFGACIGKSFAIPGFS